MSRTGTLRAAFFLALGLPLAGCCLWLMHATAWDLGGRSPVLNYDSAQYALAARELATHGRLATTFALPIELVRHARPPWPLATIQPGLVLVEAALFRLAPSTIHLGRLVVPLSRPDQREWLVLVAPFCCFILIGLLLAVITSRLLRRYAPGVPEGRRLAAAMVVALAFYLDPEAQHFACGGFTELPFMLGLVLAVAALALGPASRRPFLFGLLLGLTGSFRANMLWLAPLFALAACAMPDARGKRVRVLALALAGYALPLAPWWIYKWRAFGTPAWDLSRFVIWDRVGGRTWFSLYHQPAEPVVPHGWEALRLLAAKARVNVRPLALGASTGTRALWLGSIIVWLVMARPWSRVASRSAAGDAAARPEGGSPGPEIAPSRSIAAPAADVRPLAITAIAVLLAFAFGVVAAAVSIPWLRYVFPTRMLIELTGILALWSVVTMASELASLPGWRRGLYILVGLLVLGWGLFDSYRGNLEAHTTSATRAEPNVINMMKITVLMNREIPDDEPVMSNLGPLLAWTARRPVLHLAESPDELEACRRKLEFRNVLLVFRAPANAWGEWREVVSEPARARDHAEWNVDTVREWLTSDGFRVIWLTLKPAGPRFAAAPARSG
ncbi:MAG TPA: hypothetical protein VMS88_00030 [Terriglobales bacterium]|nr:hypothetical protein [Terriglobales bacterium]